MKKNTASLVSVIALVIMALFAGEGRSQQFVTDGLISFWTFDEGTIAGGTVEDIWGNNNATIMGDTTTGDGKIGQALLFAELGQCGEPLGGIGARGPTHLGKAFGAQVDRAAVRLAAVVAAAHVALVRRAVLDREHVASFVGGGLDSPQQAQPEGRFAGLGISVPIDGPYAQALAQVGLAEDEVPAVSGP